MIDAPSKIDARTALWHQTPPCRQMAALRVAAQVSQGEAADLIGLSRSALSAAENGRRGWYGEEDLLLEAYGSVLAEDPPQKNM